MKNNNTEMLLKETVQKLIEELKQGHTEGFLKYLDFCSKFHKYSFNNRLLIAVQFPIATHVAGFKDWNKLGRHVNKGEKSIKILRPLIVEKKDKAGIKTGEKIVCGYTEVSVFDISQTSGEAIPNEATIIFGSDQEQNYKYLVQIMNMNNILVNEVDLGDSLTLRGRSFGGRIEVNQYLPINHKFKTGIHEFAHEYLHQGSENSSIILSSALREFEAEATAYVVSAMLGMDATTSKDYILGWIKCEEFDETKFAFNLNRVLEASSFIMGQFEKYLGHEAPDYNNQEDLPIAA